MYSIIAVALIAFAPAPLPRNTETLTLSVKVGVSQKAIQEVIAPHRVKSYTVTFRWDHSWDVRVVIRKNGPYSVESIMKALQKENLLVEYEVLPPPKEEK